MFFKNIEFYKQMFPYLVKITQKIKAYEICWIFCRLIFDFLCDFLIFDLILIFEVNVIYLSIWYCPLPLKMFLLTYSSVGLTNNSIEKR